MLIDRRAPSAFNKIIQPEDISIGVLESYQGPRLSAKSTTLFMFILLLDFYRMAVRDSGDSPFSQASWTQAFRDITFTIHPERGGGMQHSHAFFAIAWIWLWMSDLVPGAASHTGFFERNYAVLKKDALPQHRFGYIQLEATPEGDSG